MASMGMLLLPWLSVALEPWIYPVPLVALLGGLEEEKGFMGEEWKRDKANI